MRLLVSVRLVTVQGATGQLRRSVGGSMESPGSMQGDAASTHGDEYQRQVAQQLQFLAAMSRGCPVTLHRLQAIQRVSVLAYLQLLSHS